MEDATCINGTYSQSFQSNSNLASLPHLLAGLTIFLLTLPCLLFQLRSLPVGSTVVVLLGALLMVLSQLVPQHEVYDVISKQPHNTCIFMLISMMILANYFEREELFSRLLRILLKPQHSFANYIWRICFVTSITSSIFTSDATCAILTPVILNLWEFQERNRQELSTIILAIATSANIGSVLVVFGSPHVALIASTTSMPAFTQSRLNLRTCLFYLGPCVLVAFMLNLVFLLLHHKLRTLNSDNTQLISDVSHSEQEMASLTNASPKTSGNGYAHYIDDEEAELHESSEQETNCDEMDTETQSSGGGGYREPNTPPCTLETILEDEILEITSEPISGHSLSSLRALSGADVSCDLSAIGSLDDNHSRDSNEHIQTRELNVENDTGYDIQVDDAISMEPSPRQSFRDISYEPGALSVGNISSPDSPHLWTPNTTKTQEQYGLLLSKCGIYRSFSAISAVKFLSLDSARQVSKVYRDGRGKSGPFRVLCCVLVVTIMMLFLFTDLRASFDIGLVPLAAAVIALAADAILNKRGTMATIEQLDWSVVMLFYATFVWMHGFNKTNLIPWIWDKLYLTDSSYDNFSSIAFLCVFVLIGTNISNNFIVTIVLLNQLIPCENQLSMVLYITWTSALAGNMMLFGSVSNVIVIQKAQTVTKHRMSFWAHFQFGFISTLVLLPVGLLMIYGLLQIPGIHT